MKQEQSPKNVAVPAENFSGAGGISAPKVTPANPFVSQEETERVRQQIAGVFKGSASLYEKNDFESERSAFQQASDMAKIIPTGLLAKFGLDHPWARPFLFWGNNKDKKDKNSNHG